jgi:cysteine desulfurase/selenocysteine lyase
MIYLDNAATTWPKPKEVIAAINDCVNKAGANPGRGGHKMALAAGRIILDVREALARLFKVNDPGRIVFTGNATESLNFALKGLLQTGDHIITSAMEHNAVARPIHLLKSKGIEVTEIGCSQEGFLDPDKVSQEVKKNTRAVAILHASNVTGTIMPIEEIGRTARENGISFIVDAAQTAGVLDIDVNKMNIDLLAFTGHKGLYGPQGTGGLYIRDGIELEQIIEGGTGSNSESLDQPQEMPDKFESGTPNTAG